MKKSILILGCLVALIQIGCQKDKYQYFNDIARVQMESTDDIRYSFFYEDRETVDRDTVYVTVNTVGFPDDRPRRIALEQISEYDITYKYDNKGNLIDSVVVEKPNKAVPDVHYVSFTSEIMQAGLVVEPGQVAVDVPVVLLRDESLRTKEFRLCLKVVATDDFALGESDMLTRTIIFTDKLSEPNKWDSRYWGTYSVRKHEFMYEVAGEKIDDEWCKRVAVDYSEQMYFVNKFKNALEAWKNEHGGEPMREDQNDPTSPVITFP